MIRLVNGSDAAYVKVIAALHEETFPKIIFPVTQNGYWWLAYEDKLVAGFAHLSVSDRYPSTGYFARVGVLPDFRGRSLQYKFMEKAECKAKSLGWEAIVSDTTNKPYSAANFIKRGYSNFTPEIPWGSDKTLYWHKEL